MVGRRGTKGNEQATEQFTLRVPGLRTRPVIGGGCCAVPAKFLIEEILEELPQVRAVLVSEEGAVQVWVDRTSTKLVEEAKGRIESLGYEAEGEEGD